MASIPNITQASDAKAQDNEQHIDTKDFVEPNSSRHQTNVQTDTGGGIWSGATQNFATVGEAAKQYLPTSVVTTLQNAGVVGPDGNATLPSQETRFSGSRGGVGTLPGRPSEAEVAKLPEERKLQEEVGRPLGREGVLNTDAEVKPIGLAESLERDHKKRAEHATGGTDTAAKFINLDAIPTPDETPGTDQVRHESDLDKNKPLPPSGNDTTYAKDQATRHAAKTEPTGHMSKKAPGTHHKEHVGPRMDDGFRQGSIDSANEAKDKAKNSAKPSLSQKVKGEVKVLTGKLANNPSKVDAGQAMKKGTA